MVNLEVVDLCTEQDLKGALPKGMSKSIPDGLVDQINSLIQRDDLMRQGLKANILGYMSVLKEGRWAMKDYINAVRFVTYRLSAHGVTEAYAVVFPERYAKMQNDGVNQKYIASVSTQYNKSKIVTKLMSQAMVPVYLLNADVFQDAINQQAILMVTAKSELVRTQAANSLLTHLKAPEKTKMELEITTTDTGVIQELNDTLKRLASQQIKSIEEGQYTAGEMAQSNIINMEPVER